MSQTPRLTSSRGGRVLAALILPLVALPTALAAQSDDLLVVAKRKDLVGRARLLRLFDKTRVAVNFEKASMKDVISFLEAATGRRVNFILGGKGIKSADLPRISLQLKNISLRNLLAVIQEKTDLRFTYNSGVVFLKPKDQVKAYAYLRIYDVRAAVAMVKHSLPPKLGLRPPGEEPPLREEPEPKPIHGYDLEQLIELVRSHAAPTSWEREGVSIDGMNGILLVRQTVAGHAAVRRILVQFGAIPGTGKRQARRPAAPRAKLRKPRSRRVR